MAERQNGGMAEWRNGGMAEWQIVMDNGPSYSSQIELCEALPFLVRCTCVHKKGVTAGAFIVSLSTLQTMDLLQSTYAGIR